MDVFAHCENLVREADKDRFLASLFAPAEGRRDLLALYAFNAEVAGVQGKVREPLAGEIRLQYWHDLVAGTGEPGANPVAAALLEIVKRHALPRQPLLELLEARRFDLYEETFSTRADLENYASNTSSAVIELAMRILDQPSGATPGLARSAGIAYAIKKGWLILLRHKLRRFRGAFGRAQQGHRGALRTSATIRRRRMVAIELGM